MCRRARQTRRARRLSGSNVDLFHVPTGGLIARKRLQERVYSHSHSEPDGAFHVWDPLGGSLVRTVDRSASYISHCAASGRDFTLDE